MQNTRDQGTHRFTNLPYKIVFGSYNCSRGNYKASVKIDFDVFYAIILMEFYLHFNRFVKLQL